MDNDERSTTFSARVVGDCSVALWGLPPLERLRRQLGTAGVSDVATADQGPAPRGATIVLRADWLYDQRTIADLTAGSPVIVKRGQTAIAACVPAELVDQTIEYLRGERAAPPAGPAEISVGALSAAYDQKLLKAQPADVFPVRPENRAALERHVFDGTYKGITDIVTKWLWPAPARAVVRLCTRLGISPNSVTVSSVVLVLGVTWLFWRGQYGLGLVLGWLMTFFDTVDGKLARVTVSSSSIGHALDKGTDLIHPPIWYVAWGYGLQASGGPSGSELWDVFLVILVGYIGGRLIEGAFEFFLGDFVFYAWQPVDAWVRLIIARRNPNMLLLTASALAGRPDLGLYAVAAWTAVSTVYLIARLLYGIFLRLTRGPLESWLKSVNEGDPRLSARVFAQRQLPAELRSV